MDKECCRNCLRQIEEENSIYQVLQFHHILDNLLKYADWESLKSSRLVCKRWNDRALLRFPNKFNLVIPPLWDQRDEEYDSDDDSESSDEEYPELHETEDSDVENFERKDVITARTRLANVDQRLISSLRICESFVEFGKRSTSNTIIQSIQYLKAANLTSTVKYLDIKWVEVQQLEEFVLALQAGMFRNLEYLSITGYGENVDQRWRFPPNLLPNLRSMRILARNKFEDEHEAITLNDHRLFYQSLVQAAPNLEELETAVGLPLDGMTKLKRISVMSDWSENDDEGTLTTNTHIFWKPIFDMLDTLKENLVSLDLSEIHFRPLIPVLKNLKELKLSFICLRGEEDEEPDDDEEFFTSFPNLKKMILDFSESNARENINWLRYILGWAASSFTLEELQLLYVPLPNPKPKKGNEENNRGKRETTRLILHEVLNMSASVPRVVIKIDRNVHISELLRILRSVEVNKRVQEKIKQGRKVLEFQNGNWYSPGWKNNKRLKHFPKVVNNLMKNWDHVDFKYFRVREMQVDLLMSSMESGSAEIYYKPS